MSLLCHWNRSCESSPSRAGGSDGRVTRVGPPRPPLPCSLLGACRTPASGDHSLLWPWRRRSVLPTISSTHGTAGWQCGRTEASWGRAHVLSPLCAWYFQAFWSHSQACVISSVLQRGSSRRVGVLCVRLSLLCLTEAAVTPFAVARDLVCV